MSEEYTSWAPVEGYDPLRVNLEQFDGPLDLLLHLVRQRKLDIQQLRLSEITEPYLAYVQQIQELDLDRAGEFLAIAATLIWIKSRELLPRELTDAEELDPESLEELLLRRLQEYQQIKTAAVDLQQQDMLGRDVFPRSAPPEAAPEHEGGLVFEEVTLFGLLEAFRNVLARSETQDALHVVPERQRIEDRIRQLLDTLHTQHSVYFHELFDLSAAREEIILTFISVLELVRLKAIRIVQAAPQGDIFCEATEALQKEGAQLVTRVLHGLLGREDPPLVDEQVEQPPDEHAGIPPEDAHMP